MRLSANNAPLVVIAARQTAGRGTRGRVWSDAKGQGLALTIVLDANAHDPAILPLAAAVAVVDAIGTLLSPRGPRIAVKWPNDIVHTDARGVAARKLGGILIERKNDLFLVGIGINTHQTITDWPQWLRATAVSLGQLGIRTTRPHLAAVVLSSLEAALRLSGDATIARWKRHDATPGLAAAFDHDAQRFMGIIRAVEPTQWIELELADGTLQRLPASTTVRVPNFTS